MTVPYATIHTLLDFIQEPGESNALFIRAGRGDKAVF